MTFSQYHPYKSLVDKALSADNNGWKIDLFVSIDEDCICVKCQNICKKAVSLDCEFETEKDEHKDEDIKFYCDTCMKTLLNNNGNKCPISNHSNPKYVSSRLLRRKIMKSNVLCPNSVEYQQNASRNAIETEFVIDDIAIPGTFYANEGKEKTSVDVVHGCTNFRGTLAQLINEHIHGCFEQQLMSNDSNSNGSNINRMHFHMIEELKEKNMQMSREMQTLKDENQKMNEKIETLRINFDNKIISLTHKINHMLKKQETMQNEMKMNVEMIENNPKNEKNILKSDQPLIQIPLSIHSFRKAFKQSFHPQYLLLSSTANYYGSSVCPEFAENEKDWIIFEMKDDQQFLIPTQLKILNHTYSSAIFRMEVYIGSVIDNEWHKLHSQSEITGIQRQLKTMQTFELDGYCSLQYVFNKNKGHWKHIRVNFTANHGQSGNKCCKYICCEIQFHGKSAV